MSTVDSVYLMDYLRSYRAGQENLFKADVLRYWRREEHKTCFCIETASTIAGFPDVLVITPDNRCELVEFKVSRDNDTLVFEKSQPLFYRRYSTLPIKILAWHVPTERMIWVSPAEVVAAKTLHYRLR